MRKSVVKNIWEIKKIKEIGRVVTGKTPPTKVKKYFGNEYPFITPTDIAYNSRYVIMPARYLSKEGYEYQGSLALPKNTVCFTCIGSTIGKMAITNKVSFTNQQINSIIVDSNIADYRYIFYLLKTQVERIKNYAGGAAKPIVNKSIFKEISISCPPLPIQQKIASILSTYDDLNELSERRIKILEEMARLIYKEWFVKFRFPGHEKVKFVDSELGKIPEGWEIKKLEEMATIKGGKKFSADEICCEGKYPVFGGNGIQGYSSRCMYEGFVIAFGRVGAYCGSIHWSYNGAWLNNNASSVVPHCNPEVLLGHLLNFNFVNLRGGSAQPFISNSSLASIKLLFPPDKISNDFCKIAKSLRLHVETLKGKNKTLRCMRDLLLPKLFSREINVSDLYINTKE